MAHDLSKPFQMDPEMKPEQSNQHLQEALDHQMVFSLPGRAYQQQAKVASVQCITATVGTVGYAPQVIQNSTPHAPDDKRSTLTYGVCVEGTGCAKANSSPNQKTKLDSASKDLVGRRHAMVQKQRQNERGLCGNLVQQEPVPELEKADEAQQLLLQEDTQGRPQPFPSLLEERVPAISGEGTGSYKQQAVECLPSTLAVTQAAASEGESPPSSIPNSLFSVCAGNDVSQERSILGRWTAWDSLAWTHSQWPPSRFQGTGCFSGASEGLRSEPKPLSASSDLPQDNTLLPGLFRDLELKVQWDHGPDENAALS